MPVAGAKPKEDRTQIRHRNKPAEGTEWVEVDDVPFTGAPPMPARATGGISVMITGAANSEDWPENTRNWYRAISRMPHAKLWDAAAWQFVFDSLEIHARTIEGWRGYTGPEIRAREKQIGMLPDHRRDLRIRYVKPKTAAEKRAERERAAQVTKLDDYRAL